jgi:hypothetical protein
MSLARRHQARVLARIATAAAVAAVRPPSGPEATEYEHQRARLGVDLRRLKELQSIEAKIELKRQLLPAYVPWVDGVLDAEAAGQGGFQDDIFTQVMVWRIDVGDFEGALPLISYVLRHGLALPERFERTAATMIAEEIAEAAIKRLGQGEDFGFDLLQQVDGLTAKEDMPDQVRAKLQKAMGLQLVRSAAAIEPGADGPAGGKRAAIEGALRFLRRALELNPKAGVKAEIGKLEREAKALAPPAE